MIVPKYFEDLNVLHKNTMPNRAYYIPASVPMDLQPETERHQTVFFCFPETGNSVISRIFMM